MQKIIGIMGLILLSAGLVGCGQVSEQVGEKIEMEESKQVWPTLSDSQEADDLLSELEAVEIERVEGEFEDLESELEQL